MQRSSFPGHMLLDSIMSGDQDSGTRLSPGVDEARGSDTVKVEPCPTWLSTAIAPPCACTTHSAIESPNPLPPAALDRAGSAQMLVTILTGVFDPPPEFLNIPWIYLLLLIAAAIVSMVAAVLSTQVTSRRPVVEALRDL